MIDDGFAKSRSGLCAIERFQGSVTRTTQEIQRGNCEVCGAVSDCLARQVGTYLGQMDRTVKAVFRYQADETTPRQAQGKGAPQPRKGGINLVAWVGRRSLARLRTDLLKTGDQELTVRFTRASGAPPSSNVKEKVCIEKSTAFLSSTPSCPQLQRKLP